MLNLASLLMLLTFVIGPVSGFASAHAHQAGIAAAILFAIGGLALGFFLGAAANKWAYRALHARNLGSGLGLLVYTAIPLVGILIVAIIPVLVAGMVYGAG